jgi:formylglycine-generating enzyme required for sulfatase activity
MNLKEEITNLKDIIVWHESRLAKLEQQLKESELPFEIAPVLLEKGCVNWYEAVEYCALLGNGWRLPSRDELKIIYNSDNDLNGNCNYWSSAVCNDRSRAWYQNMHKGDQYTIDKDFNSNEYRVRPVRDIIKSTLPFVIAAKAFEVKTDWYSAVKHCNALGAGWRLPTSDELDLIYTTENDFNKGYYWSSTESSFMIAMTVSMKTGQRDFEDKWQINILARAVRDI